MEWRLTVVFNAFVLCFILSPFVDAKYRKKESIDDLAKRFQSNFIDKGQRKPSDPLPKLDVEIILDASESFGLIPFLESVKFIKGLLGFFSISPSSTRVAVIKSSTEITTVLNFKNCTNRECLTDTLEKMTFDSDGSNLEKAFKTAFNLYKRESSGARSNSERVVLLLSDGEWDKGRSPSNAARKLEDELDAEIFVMGISRRQNGPELEKIASSLDDHLYIVKEEPDLRRILKNIDESLSYYQCKIPGAEIYDECNRKCSCIGGKLIDCCRERSEITSMNFNERARYLRAYKILTTEEPYKTKYIQLTTLHIKLFKKGIYKKRQFLPWHRWYLLELENLLREIDCRVTIPYWAWSYWSQNPWDENGLWKEDEDGLGGNGGTNGSCVKTGQFSLGQGGWLMPDNLCLTRNFRGNVPDAVAVATVLSLENFVNFEKELRNNLHASVSCLIGGTMCSTSASFAPEFPLHHGYIDKLWSDWQEKSDENKLAYFPSIDGPMEGLPYQRCELTDLLNQPGNVRICYEEPKNNHARSVSTVLDAYTIEDLSLIPRLGFTSITEESLKLFKVGSKERKDVIKCEKTLHGTTQRNMNLQGVSSILGFEVENYPVEEDHTKPISPDQGSYR